MAGDYFKNANPVYESTVYESTVYEKFINKKWVERKDIMQSKKSFVIEVSKELNGLDEEQ